MRKILFLQFVLAVCMCSTFGVRADDGSGFAMINMQQAALKEQAKTEKLTTCGETEVSFDGIQSPSDNEFLYDTLQAYNSVKNRPDGGSVLGIMYECDNEHCTDGKVQNMNPGHVFRGRVVNKVAKYRCNVGMDDRWVEIFEGCEHNGSFFGENEWYGGVTKTVVNAGECWQFDSNINRSIDKFFIQCVREGESLVKRCFPAEGAQPEKPAEPVKPVVVPPAQENNPVVSPDPIRGKTCREKRAGADWSEKARACCDLSASAAVVEGKTGCRCLAEGKTFKVINGRGVCVSDEDGVVVPGVGGFTCPDEGTWFALYKQRCANDAEALKVIADVENACATKIVKTQEEYDALRDVLQLYMAECGVASEVVVPVPDDGSAAASIRVRAIMERIKSNSSVLRGMVAEFDTSVWKTQEGKFNTARLASDSIAGVVLGTAGGLITSNVIKKNQVKNGLEDIQCTVGGQAVAGFGDQFRVGIQ